MRFQYYIDSELWGRRKKAGAGNGKTGASAAVGREANPSGKPKV